MNMEKTRELYEKLLTMGYPKEFCAEIAFKNLNTEFTATRMINYLYKNPQPKIEELVDEMLAIISDRDAIVEKKQMEKAQSVINEMYRNGLENVDEIW